MTRGARYTRAFNPAKIRPRWKRNPREKRTPAPEGLTAAQVAFIASDDFLRTPHYRRWRHDLLERYEARCMACGRTPREHRIVINTDHIKPRKLHPQLCLEPCNGQLLCEDENAGKGNRSEKDWRPNPTPIVSTEAGRRNLWALLKWLEEQRKDGKA